MPAIVSFWIRIFVCFKWNLTKGTHINRGLSTDLMCVNDARLTSSRSTASANAGGDDDSSVDVIGVEDYGFIGGITT